MDKALELWKRLFERTTSPWIESNAFDIDAEYCFFCSEWRDEGHAPDCIWIEAKKLVEENKE